MEQITIQGQLFNVPLPFAAGHVLTAGQAATLNQTYHEGIRNNLAKKAKEGTLTQEDVDAYAEEYKDSIGDRSGGGGPQNPILTKAMNIARAKVKQRLKELIGQPGSAYYGRKISDFTAEAITSAAKAIIEKDPSIMETAREQVELERKHAASAIQDLTDILAAPATA